MRSTPSALRAVRNDGAENATAIKHAVVVVDGLVDRLVDRCVRHGRETAVRDLIEWLQIQDPEVATSLAAVAISRLAESHRRPDMSRNDHHQASDIEDHPLSRRGETVAVPHPKSQDQP